MEPEKSSSNVKSIFSFFSSLLSPFTFANRLIFVSGRDDKKCIEFKCHNSNSIDTFSYPLRLRSATALHLSLTICALDQYFLQLNSQEILFL